MAKDDARVGRNQENAIETMGVLFQTGQEKKGVSLRRSMVPYAGFG